MAKCTRGSTKTMTIELPEAEHRAFKAVISAEGMNQNDVVRELLSRWVGERKGKVMEMLESLRKPGT